MQEQIATLETRIRQLEAENERLRADYYQCQRELFGENAELVRLREALYGLLPDWLKEQKARLLAELGEP